MSDPAPELSSRAFAAYAELLSMWTEALAGSGVVIYDGPQVGIPTDPSHLLFGVEDATAPLATSFDAGQQDWSSLGALNRTEVGTIFSTYTEFSGATDPAELARMRVVAQSNIALLEASLRTPDGVTLNQVLNYSGWCSLSLTRFQQMQTEDGCVVTVQIAVTYTVQI